MQSIVNPVLFRRNLMSKVLRPLTRLTRSPRSLALAVALLGVWLQGCASTGDPMAGPPIELTVTLDRTDYRLGDPLVATVTLKNASESEMVLPSFDHQAVRFMVGEKGSNARVHHEAVHSPQVISESRTLAPGRAVSRPFLLTRATLEAGEFAVLASFRGLIFDGEMIRDTVYAPPQPFQVDSIVGLLRDRGNGLILKEQAVALAREQAKGEVRRTRAVLMPLGETGLFTWVVMVREVSGGTERSYAVEVNPYVGSVKPVALKEAGRLPGLPGSTADKATDVHGPSDRTDSGSEAVREVQAESETEKQTK
jgi:hypothetical protein